MECLESSYTNYCIDTEYKGILEHANKEVIRALIDCISAQISILRKLSFINFLIIKENTSTENEQIFILCEIMETEINIYTTKLKEIEDIYSEKLKEMRLKNV